MRKLVLLSIVAALVLSLGIVAFADSTNNTPQWYNDMIEWRKAEMQEAVRNGEVTEEYAKYWNEEMDRMKEYNNKYDYSYGYGQGPGHGMMGRYRNNSVRGFEGSRFMNNFGPGFCHR